MYKSDFEKRDVGEVIVYTVCKAPLIVVFAKCWHIYFVHAEV